MWPRLQHYYEYARGDLRATPEQFTPLALSTVWLSIKWIIIFVSLLTTPAIQLLYQKF